MMTGWVAIHRELCDHKLWTLAPFTPGQAWVDLILLANHADGWLMVRGNKVQVKRGQVGWSEASLASRWKWSRGKVRRFISELQNEQQIEQQKNFVTSVISIVNYDRYQPNGQQNGQENEHQTDSRQTADGQQTDTNNNDNNDQNENNDKKVSIRKHVRLTDSEIFKLVEAFGLDGANQRIDALNEYIGSKKKRYNDHYLTILNWERMDKKRGEKGERSNKGQRSSKPVDGSKKPGSVDVGEGDRKFYERDFFGMDDPGTSGT